MYKIFKYINKAILFMEANICSENVKSIETSKQGYIQQKLYFISSVWLQFKSAIARVEQLRSYYNRGVEPQLKL